MTPTGGSLDLPSVWLHELTWEEVASYLRSRDTIIVPFGTTEQHGPAGSLGLDGYVAISLAEDAAKKAGVKRYLHMSALGAREGARGHDAGQAFLIILGDHEVHGRCVLADEVGKRAGPRRDDDWSAP